MKDVIKFLVFSINKGSRKSQSYIDKAFNLKKKCHYQSRSNFKYDCDTVYCD